MTFRNRFAATIWLGSLICSLHKGGAMAHVGTLCQLRSPQQLLKVEALRHSSYLGVSILPLRGGRSAPSLLTHERLRNSMFSIELSGAGSWCRSSSERWSTKNSSPDSRSNRSARRTLHGRTPKASPALAERPTSQSKGEERESKVPYNWKTEWYPVYLTEQMPKDRPMAFTLFDTPLVLFYDGHGKLNCVEDRCPHRAAKLSEGQVGGSLNSAFRM